MRLWSTRIDTSGRKFILNLRSLLKVTVFWESVSASLIAVAVVRAQQHSGLEYCAAAATAAITLHRPIVGLAIPIVATLGLIHAVDPGYILITWIVWAAVVFGRMNCSTYPVIAAGWTVLCAGMIVPLLTALDVTLTGSILREALRPSVTAVILTWSFTTSVEIVRSRGSWSGLHSLVALVITGLILAASVNITGNRLLLAAATVISILSPVVASEGEHSGVTLAAAVACSGFMIGLLSIASAQLLCMIGLVITAGLRGGIGTACAGIVIVHGILGLVSSLWEPELLITSTVICVVCIICGYGLKARGVGAEVREQKQGTADIDAIIGRIADSVNILRGHVDGRSQIGEHDQSVTIIRSTVCRGCGAKRKCWQEDYEKTAGAMAACLEDNSAAGAAVDFEQSFCRREGHLKLAIIMARAMTAVINDGNDKLRAAYAVMITHISDVTRLLETDQINKQTDIIRWSISRARHGDRRGVLPEILVSEQESKAAVAVATIKDRQRASALRNLQQLVASGLKGRTIRNALMSNLSTGRSNVQCDIVTVDMHTGTIEIIQVGLTLVILCRSRRLEALLPAGGAKEPTITKRLVSDGDAVIILAPPPDEREVESLLTAIGGCQYDYTSAEQFIELVAARSKQKMVCLAAAIQGCK